MPNPPKFDPNRGTRGRGPLKLPAEGYRGAIPAWPLGDTPTEAEEAAWSDLWRTPQAAAWSRLGWLRTVGRYCRLMVAAEEHGASAALLAQVTALEDRLGLTPKAMRASAWRVGSFCRVTPLRRQPLLKLEAPTLEQTRPPFNRSGPNRPRHGGATRWRRCGGNSAANRGQ